MVSSKPAASVSAALILCGTLLMGGCAQPSVVKTALNGDLKQLQQEIRESQQRGDLDRDTVQDLARAVARREVHSAKGEMAVVRVQQVRACTPHVADVLRDRAQRNDDAGGVARVALLEAGIDRDERLVAEYREASSGAWRAVAARSAIGGSHGAVRRSLFLDGDERVRQAALRAALEEPDLRDLDQLLEAARLDPDPLCRSIAARAVGNVGGERAVLGLKDLWAAADEETRLVLIEAWAMPAAFKAGGERELLKVSETSTGLPSVAAAGALLRGKGARGRPRPWSAPARRRGRRLRGAPPRLSARTAKRPGHPESAREGGGRFPPSAARHRPRALVAHQTKSQSAEAAREAREGRRRWGSSSTGGAGSGTRPQGTATAAQRSESRHPRRAPGRGHWADLLRQVGSGGVRARRQQSLGSHQRRLRHPLEHDSPSRREAPRKAASRSAWAPTGDEAERRRSRAEWLLEAPHEADAQSEGPTPISTDDSSCAPVY